MPDSDDSKPAIVPRCFFNADLFWAYSRDWQDIAHDCQPIAPNTVNDDRIAAILDGSQGGIGISER